MRKELGKKDGQRLRFKATVQRFGTKTNYHGYPEKTVLLSDVFFASDGSVAADHLWFSVGKTIDSLGLTEGAIVAFDARIGTYEKGYVNYRKGIDDRSQDWKLTRPTKFELLAN
jgi:hypothetical protein